MNKGIAAIGASGLVTVIAWAVSRPAEGTSPASQIAELCGALALTALAGMLIIATRARPVDRLFGGMDKAYVVHKWLGVATFGLLAVHVVILAVAGPRGQNQNMLVHAGAPAMVLLLGAVAFALFARRVGYEAWKLVHLLTVAPYAIGVAHYYGSSSYGPLTASPFSLWLDLANLAGACAAVYVIVFFGRLGLRYAYTVSAVRPITGDIIEITAAPVGRPLRFRPGQFAFVQIPRLKFASHPFTVSSGQGEPLQFTVRARGDDTASLVHHLEVGDRLDVGGPYGGLDYSTGSACQLWIAGGIGITPFRSFYRSGVPDRFDVDLFYAYEGEDGAYLDELRAIDQPNLRVHLIDAAVQGLLTAGAIVEMAPSDKPRDVYFCGPAAMRNAIHEPLKATGGVSNFHAEEFGFGRPTKPGWIKADR